VNNSPIDPENPATDAAAAEPVNAEPVVAEPSRVLNVAALRQELERLERHGCGDWEIDVVPALSIPGATDARPDLAFDVRRYGVTSVNALGGGPDSKFVMINFAPAD
jgi:hypothetical protein